MTAIRAWWMAVLLCGSAAAQTCLAVSAPEYPGNGTVTFEVLLYTKGERPAALEWRLEASTDVTQMTIEEAPALQSVVKAAFCKGSAGSALCIVAGANVNTISNGSIAKVTATLAPGASTAQLRITNPLAVSLTGLLIPVFSKTETSTAASLYRSCPAAPVSRRSVTP